MQVTGDKNVAARGDIHIHASKSWFSDFTPHIANQLTLTRRKKLLRASVVGIFVLIDAAVSGVLAMVPPQPPVIVGLLVFGAVASTLLSIYFCTPKP